MPKPEQISVWEFQVKEFDNPKDCNEFLKELAERELFLKAVNTVFDCNRNRVLHVVVYGKQVKGPD